MDEDGSDLLLASCVTLLITMTTILLQLQQQQVNVSCSLLAEDLSNEEDDSNRGRSLYDRLRHHLSAEDSPGVTYFQPRPECDSSPWRQILQHGDSRTFLKWLRLSKSDFLKLADELRSELEKPVNFFTRANGDEMARKRPRLGCRVLSHVDILGLTLKRLASGCDLQTLSIMFGVAHATAEAYSLHGLRCIVDVLSYEGRWFDSDEEKFESMSRFQAVCPSLPGVIVACDCKEWPIDVPGKFVQVVSTQGDAGLYYNGKSHQYSEKSMSLVDSLGIIRHSEYPKPGSYTDKRMFNESEITANAASFVRDGIDFIVCDGGFTETDFIYMPIAKPRGAQSLSREQKTANRQLSAIRIISEWQFAILQQTFQILQRKQFGVALRHTSLVHHSCILLHNRRARLYGNLISIYFDNEVRSSMKTRLKHGLM